jgi:hypothetical protein
MTVLEVNGQHVDVDDSFMKLSSADQEKTVHEIAANLGGAKAPADPANTSVSANNLARATAEGVPVAGGLLNNLNAATNATLAPVVEPFLTPSALDISRHGETWMERRNKSLAMQNAQSNQFSEAHPYIAGGAGLIGGAASLGGVAGAIPKAAEALGMTGKVLPAMRNAALSGGAIGAADAATRGEDISQGGMVGALTGPAGVLLGKGAGAVFDKVRGAVRGGDPVPTRFMDVNGTQVPVRESVLTGSPDASRTEQALLKAGQPSALQGEEATAAAMAKAHADLSAQLDPTGTSPGATPMQAGDAVASDLVSAEQQRAAAEVARAQRAANGTRDIRTAIDLPPSAPAPEMPLPAGQAISEGIGQRFQAARGATRSAYQAAGEVPGEFNAGRLLGAGEDIRLRLNSAPGDARVRVSPEVTPAAQNMLRTIDDEISQLRFTNDAARGSRPITPADMEQVRKQLVIQRRGANNAARSTGNWEDARAAGRVMDEFDNWLGRTVQRPGSFSGDAGQYLQAQQAARQAHAMERATFSRRGPGDQVGAMMENIVGKYPGQEMSPEKIVRTLLGSPDNPGGAEHAVAALEHLRNTLGPRSPEWAALKKATISHFTEPQPGGEAIPLEKQAQRIQRFLGNERHASQLFDHGERARLASHAQALNRATDPLPVKGTPEQKIAVLSGRITGEPATGEQVLSAIKRDPRLARDVMSQVSPQSRSLLKQSLWKEVSEAPEGMIAWGPQKTGQKIAAFLNTELAREAFTPNERMLMKAIGDAHQKLVPVPGSTNPSGTAHMMAKIANGSKNQLLALFGFSHGGLPGASLALTMGKGLEWAINKRAANEATRLFLGPQAKPAASRAPQAIGALAGPLTARNRQ